MALHTWLTFFIACWAISISPGPGAIAAMSSGLNYGFRRGYFTTFGLVLGIWTQILLVGVGLGAVIATAAHAFTVVKWAGVAYLVWLGIGQWRASDQPLVAATEGVPRTRLQMIVRAWGMNAVNPKGTVFLLAVVPQFLDLSQPLLPQYLVITASLSFTDLVVMAGYTALASHVLRLLNEAHPIRWMNRTFGTLFIAAGVLLASFKRSA